MTIDERIERLATRAERLVITTELSQRERQADSERIQALARIAERRLESLERGQQ
jgi:hypothetical protein